MLLELKGVDVHYNKVQAISNISIQIDEGQIVIYHAKPHNPS